MNKIILADSQAIFRAGTAKVLAMDEDLRIIAQCADLERMFHAITTFPGSLVIFAASLRPDLGRLRMVLESTGSRGIVIAENSEDAPKYLKQGFHGVVYRSVSGTSLAECVRRVSAGDVWQPSQISQVSSPDDDMVGTRVRDRLTPKEMRIVALIDERELIERILRHLGLWQQGVRVESGPDPPGELVIEPCLDDVSPDYDTDPDLIYANG